MQHVLHQWYCAIVLNPFSKGIFGKQPKDGSMYLSVLAIAAWVALCLNVKSSTKGIRILKDKSKHAQCVHIQTKTYTCNCTHINVPSTNCSALISAHITYHEQIQFQDEGIVIYLVKQILKENKQDWFLSYSQIIMIYHSRFLCLRYCGPMKRQKSRWSLNSFTDKTFIFPGIFLWTEKQKHRTHS